MITAGVDVGSLTGKTVIFEDNHIVSWSLVQTGPDSAETAKESKPSEPGEGKVITLDSFRRK